LTFDDGPIPEVTPWVLDQLAEHEAKATFFCVGENAVRHPNIYSRIHAGGHTVGNHTYNHLNGWTTSREDYLKNVEQCASVVDSRLFRPPYGKLTRRKALVLQEQYKLVMWDVLSGDFDQSISPEACFQNVASNTKPGSIIVFHDSLKSELNLRYALPKVLSLFSERNYEFEALS